MTGEVHPALRRGFDPDWFRRFHPHLVLPASDEALAEWYRAEGRAIGLPPNAFLDPAWRRGRGKGARHWLFEPEHYLAACRTARPGAPAPADPWTDFWQYGDRQGLAPGRFFHPATYLAGLSPRTAEEARRIGACRHFLTTRLPGCPEPPLSPWFDPDWYLAQHPEVASGIAAGTFPAALAHYLSHRGPPDLDPVPLFSERIYRAANPDIDAAIRNGALVCGYDHFLALGRDEGRRFGPGPDLSRYLACYPGARRDVEAGKAPDLFAHMLQAERARRPRLAPNEAHSRALFEMQAGIAAGKALRHPLDFTLHGPAEISVVVIADRRSALTLACLASLADQEGGPFTGRIELLLAGEESELNQILPGLRARVRSAHPPEPHLRQC